MKRLLLIALFALCSMTPLGIGGPSKGGYYKKERVDANGEVAFDLEFEGAKRACVTAIGDHQPEVIVEITVIDMATKKVVAQDVGGHSDSQVAARVYKDFVAAIWYPPRTGRYQIIIGSKGKEYNDCGVAVR